MDSSRDDAVFAYQRDFESDIITCVYNFSGKPLEVSLKGRTIGDKPLFLLNEGVQIVTDDTLSMQPYAYCWTKRLRLGYNT